MKKSQMEMMGLAIIIILISLALLFVVRFVILREPSEQTKEYAQSELAANFLNAVLETNAPECNDIKFSTLFQDCANNYRDGSGGDIQCNLDFSTVFSCEYLRAKLGELFQQTFEIWNIPYYFIPYIDPDNPQDTKLGDLVLGDECTGNRRLKIQPLPLDPPDNLYLALYICE